MEGERQAEADVLQSMVNMGRRLMEVNLGNKPGSAANVLKSKHLEDQTQRAVVSVCVVLQMG